MPGFVVRRIFSSIKIHPPEQSLKSEVPAVDVRELEYGQTARLKEVSDSRHGVNRVLEVFEHLLKNYHVEVVFGSAIPFNEVLQLDGESPVAV